MARMIIVDDNLDLGVCLFNLFSSSDEVKVERIVNDGNIVIQLIKELNIDLVLLDLNMPGKNGLEIIDEIESSNNVNVKIMAISGDSSYIEKLRDRRCVIKFFNKCMDFTTLKIDILNIARGMGEIALPQRVMRYLLRAGFSTRNKGTYYLRDSIVEFSTSKEDECKIEEFFVSIASIHNTKPSKVRSNMYSSILAAKRFTNEEHLRDSLKLERGEPIVPKSIITSARLYIESK